MTEGATTPMGEHGPWPPDEFIAQLRAQGTRYHSLHPFHRRMDAGELTREELQRWVANRFYYQKCIPLKDAAILANCPEVEVRRQWIHRITDHDGTTDGTGGIESWLRLGEALGVARGELVSEQRVLPAVRYAVDAYVNFARQKPWIEAVASSLTELFGPAAIRVRLEALERHYEWIDAAGLEYFRTRLEKAPRDAQYAIDLAVERCRTREQQEAAVAALRFKTEMLWAQLEAIERGYTQPAGRMIRPRLVTGARLRYDEVREEHVMLVPEGVVRLNPTAAEVLELCDGERSLDEIVGVISARYDGSDLRDDVQGLVDGMAQRGLVVDAAE